MHQDNAENNSYSGYTIDSQDTISDDEMHSNPSTDHTSENKAVEETVMLSANFCVDKDFGNAKSSLKSGNSNVNSSDSDSDFFSSPALCYVKRTIRLKVAVR